MWIYQLGAHTIKVEREDEVFAARFEPGGPKPSVLEGALSRRHMLGVPDPGWLGRAGWEFARPHPELIAAARAEQPWEGLHLILPVFRSEQGLLIGSNRLVVRIREGVPLKEATRLLLKHGAVPERQLGFAPRLFEVKVAPVKPFLEVNEQLNEDKDLWEFSEPVMIQPLPPRWRPTGPDYQRQWQWNNDGSNGGVAGMDLRCEAAWDRARGRGVRIAVIDNGMDVNHRALKKAYTRGGYFLGTETGSGTFTPHRLGQIGFPDGPHGTFCAGMALGRASNKSGCCGAAPEANLIAVACLPDQVGSQLTLARAIAYAADPSLEDASASPDDGAHVISCSLGPNSPDWIMESVLALALEFAATRGRGGRGTPSFWAVSNGNGPIAGDEVCSSPHVLAVGRANRMGLPGGSAYGSELSFLAPGVDVYSTTSGGGYGFNTGASFAAPAAAGVAALLLQLQPGWTNRQLRDHLCRACTKIGPESFTPAAPDPQGRNDNCGFGLLNAAAAVQSALPVPPAPRGRPPTGSRKNSPRKT